MAFEIQPRGLRGPSKQPVTVSIVMNANYRRLRVAISAALAREFGWKVGDLIELGIGNGPDAGRIQLKAGPCGFALRSPARSRRLELLVPARDDWPDRHAATSVPCWPDMIHKAMKIDLPWAPSRMALVRGAA